VFPGSTGREVLETPQGEVEVPLPKAVPGKERSAKEHEEIVPQPVLPPQSGSESAKPPAKTEGPQPPSKGNEATVPSMPSGKQPSATGPALVAPAGKPQPTEKPAAETPAPGKPAVEQPAPEKPSPAEKAVPAEKPSFPATPEKAAPEKPVLGKPSPEKPAVEKPAAEKPAPEKPAPEKPAPTKPSAEKPSSLKPVPKEEEELLPAEPSKDSPSARPREFGGQPAPQAAPAPAAAMTGPNSVSAAGLHADWDTAFYGESMSGGRLRLVAAAAVPAARQDVQLVAYSEEAAGSALPLLDGYCPVELRDHERWVRGNARYQASYRGLSLWFSGAAQREQFLAAPERYVPGWSGNDPVLWLEESRQVRGTTQHSAVYNQRLYLFAGATTLQRFQRSPERYSSPGR
jgi:YHS domain-containing protein